MNITILQEKNPTFHVLEGQKFNRKDYKIVYKTTAIKFAGNPGIEHKVLLEMLFERFNRGNYPEDYKGHSMSVGDIVVLDCFVYVCKNVGWEMIEWEKDKIFGKEQ